MFSLGGWGVRADVNERLKEVETFVKQTTDEHNAKIEEIRQRHQQEREQFFRDFRESCRVKQ